MSDFLLIHDGGHGGWAWDYVRGALEDSLRRRTPLYHQLYTPGTVLAPDLPGHGSRFCRDNPSRISFEGAVSGLLQAVEGANLRSPVIAAHGLSGLLALEIARRLQGNLRRLVLIGASIPTQFTNVMEMLPLRVRLLLLALRLRPGTLPDTIRLHREIALRLWCNDMDYATASSRVLGKLQPIPLRLWDALPEPDALHPSCGVTYVLLTRDRFLPLALQRRMADSLSAEVVELDAGHEAPITHPQEVSEVLLRYL